MASQTNVLLGRQMFLKKVTLGHGLNVHGGRSNQGYGGDHGFLMAIQRPAYPYSTEDWSCLPPYLRRSFVRR